MTDRIVAIMGGGDWFDASVEHVVMDDPSRLEPLKAEWEAWYRATYLPAMSKRPRVKYLTFPEWLIAHGHATLAGDTVTEFWEHP